MSTYYVIGEEARINEAGDTTFTPYDCMPEYHSTLSDAKDELEDWFPIGDVPEHVSIWKIEKVEP